MEYRIKRTKSSELEIYNAATRNHKNFTNLTAGNSSTIPPKRASSCPHLIQYRQQTLPQIINPILSICPASPQNSIPHSNSPENNFSPFAMKCLETLDYTRNYKLRKTLSCNVDQVQAFKRAWEEYYPEHDGIPSFEYAFSNSSLNLPGPKPAQSIIHIPTRTSSPFECYGDPIAVHEERLTILDARSWELQKKIDRMFANNPQNPSVQRFCNPSARF